MARVELQCLLPSDRCFDKDRPVRMRRKVLWPPRRRPLPGQANAVRGARGRVSGRSTRAETRPMMTSWGIEKHTNRLR